MSVLSLAAAAPFLALGAWAFLSGRADPALGALLAVAATLLALRPIRLGAHTELSGAQIPLIAAVLLLPFAAAVPLAAIARLLPDLRSGRPAIHVLGRTAAAALSAGAASLAYLWIGSFAWPDTGASQVLTATLAAVVYALADAGQNALAAASHGPSKPDWDLVRTQLVWSVGAALLIEVTRLQPWFLVPGLPLAALFYHHTRARVAADRRAGLIAAVVEISRAVGTSLEPNTVFRTVYEKIRASVDVDAFYVAMRSADGSTLSYRFLIDNGQEFPATSIPAAGTLADHCIRTDRSLLMRDAERDRRPLGLTRIPWGSEVELSIMVAPLRIRGQVVGALSAQSVHLDAYDERDLELVEAIANEAAIAIERADLYDREAALSRRLVELHRVGLELGAERDLGSLTRRLSDSVRTLLGASYAAVYLDEGGDFLEFSAVAGKDATDATRVPKASPLVAAALRDGFAAVPDARGIDGAEGEELERRGHRSLAVQPLQAAAESVGVLFVTWAEPHQLDDEQRELLGLIAGIGAGAVRSIRLYAELDEAYLATVQTLTTTIQARDGYRQDHQQRVAADAVAFGARLGLTEDRVRELRYASLFHALGKIGVPQAILGKEGPLTSEETRLVREHPVLGARIIESIRFLRGVVPIVRHANERWDGSGYPDGLAFHAIPYEARLLQIVLSYHAMLAERPYRRGLEPRVALGELRLLAGTRYDPELVERFVAMIEERGGVEAARREIQEGARELAILAEITPQFSTLLDLQQMLDRIVRTLEPHWPQSRLHILLCDEPTGDLVVRAVAGPPGLMTTGLRVRPGQGIATWVVEHREAVVVDDVHADPRTVVRREDTRSLAIVPLINENRAIGTLSVANGRVGAFTRRDLTLLQAIGAQVAAAIEVAGLHERLQHAANTDGLTGLHNFRYFYDRLEEEIARAERRQTALAVAYFDIDDLKQINDRHGHVAGDSVLRTLGRAIEGHVRTEDVPARYGGDEFAIVMPETAREEAERVVRRLMELLDATSIDLGDGVVIPMPARSWGISSYPVDGSSAKELVENADTRAYARKRAKV